MATCCNNGGPLITSRELTVANFEIVARKTTLPCMRVAIFGGFPPRKFLAITSGEMLNFSGGRGASELQALSAFRARRLVVHDVPRKTPVLHGLSAVLLLGTGEKTPLRPAPFWVSTLARDSIR
jgi:hypothetical protein